MLLVNDGLVQLVDDFLELLMDDRLVKFAHLFLVDYRLMMLMNQRLMMLVHNVLVVFMEHVFVVLVDHVSVGLLDDGHILVQLLAACDLMALVDGLFHVLFDHKRLIMDYPLRLSLDYLHLWLRNVPLLQGHRRILHNLDAPLLMMVVWESSGLSGGHCVLFRYCCLGKHLII